MMQDWTKSSRFIFRQTKPYSELIGLHPRNFIFPEQGRMQGSHPSARAPSQGLPAARRRGSRPRRLLSSPFR